MITWVQILEVVPPTKFGKAKNVKNLVRFLTTFDFDRKYLQKRTVQLKSEKHLINHISSPIGRKKCGELWSTNKKVIGTHVDPHKWTFYERLLFRPLRAVAPQFFYTPYNQLKCISSRISGAGRPQVGLCPIFLHRDSKKQAKLFLL